MDFKDVVEMVKEGNEKVDELLKAARLERHERQPMDYERYKFTLCFIAGMMAMAMGFAALYMIIYYMGR